VTTICTGDARRCAALQRQRDALADAMRAIEDETRDGGQWTLAEINEVARAALYELKEGP
jgi:hypothetical protein